MRGFFMSSINPNIPSESTSDIKNPNSSESTTSQRKITDFFGKKIVGSAETRQSSNVVNAEMPVITTQSQELKEGLATVPAKAVASVASSKTATYLVRDSNSMPGFKVLAYKRAGQDVQNILFKEERGGFQIYDNKGNRHGELYTSLDAAINMYIGDAVSVDSVLNRETSSLPKTSQPKGPKEGLRTLPSNAVASVASSRTALYKVRDSNSMPGFKVITYARVGQDVQNILFKEERGGFQIYDNKGNPHGDLHDTLDAAIEVYIGDAVSVASTLKTETSSLNDTIKDSSHGQIPTDRANSLLSTSNTYLFRESTSKPGYQVLSFSSPQGRIQHVLFKVEKERIQSYGGDDIKGPSYSSIEEMLKTLNLAEASKVSPIKPNLANEINHGKIDRNTAVSYLKPRTYLFRMSTSMEGFHVVSYKNSTGRDIHRLFKPVGNGILLCDGSGKPIGSFDSLDDFIRDLGLDPGSIVKP
jgi:hypothetical protein